MSTEFKKIHWKVYKTITILFNYIVWGVRIHFDLLVLTYRSNYIYNASKQ